MMDYVPNHSSDQHEWFKKSVAREEPYTNYYIWRDAHPDSPDMRPLPPNNWVFIQKLIPILDFNFDFWFQLSVFRFSAWTWNEQRGQFYYHAFTPEQPDLNYRNPLVVEEMKVIPVEIEDFFSLFLSCFFRMSLDFGLEKWVLMD